MRCTDNMKLNTITENSNSLTETIWRTCAIWVDVKT